MRWQSTKSWEVHTCTAPYGALGGRRGICGNKIHVEDPFHASLKSERPDLCAEFKDTFGAQIRYHGMSNVHGHELAMRIPPETPMEKQSPAFAGIGDVDYAESAWRSRAVLEPRPVSTHGTNIARAHPDQS